MPTCIRGKWDRTREVTPTHPHARGPQQPWVWQSVLLRCLGFPEALRRPDPQIQVVWARAPPCPPDGAESVCICGWRQLLWSPWPQLATGHFSRAFSPSLSANFCLKGLRRDCQGGGWLQASPGFPPSAHPGPQRVRSVCSGPDCVCLCVYTWMRGSWTMRFWVYIVWMGSSVC